MKAFNSIIKFQSHFNTEDKCRQFIEYQRWGDTPACPYCASLKVTRLSDNKRFQCNEKQCRKQFSVISGTVFENTKIPLTKWFLAIYILSNHSKGIASLQLAKWLGVTQKTAWFLNHRIRELLADSAPDLLNGIVEVDETYVGGKVSNKHKSKRDIPNNANKTMVFGAVAREGKVRTKIVNDTKGQTLTDAVRESVEERSIMVSDENQSYKQLSKNYKHVSINHSKEEYVRGAAHTNTIEGFWSLLKRQIVGIHHSVTGKHLQRYCNESSFRYNAREYPQDYRFNSAFTNCERRLTYNTLIKK